MINKREALELLKKHLKNENLIKHSLAVAFCMQGLAESLGKDEDKWYLAGLLHDIDYEYTKNAPKKHGIEGAKILEGKVEEDIIYAIKAHPGNKFELKSDMDYALHASDPLSGLIVAVALVKGKKLSNVEVKSVKKRFKEKRFAAGANREQILKCENLGFSLEEFIEICLNKMKENSSELGL
jgi:putative nucleotidyltransferase with HDIG domain